MKLYFLNFFCLNQRKWEDLFLAHKNKYFFYYSIPGTLIANVIGSFLIGFFIYLIQNKNVSEDIIRYFLIIGILGSYTTFSAFSFENVELITSNKFLIAFSYIIISLILCILAAYVGLNIQKIIN